MERLLSKLPISIEALKSSREPLKSSQKPRFLVSQKPGFLLEKPGLLSGSVAIIDGLAIDFARTLRSIKTNKFILTRGRIGFKRVRQLVLLSLNVIYLTFFVNI